MRCDMNPKRHPPRQHGFRVNGYLLDLVLNAWAGSNLSRPNSYTNGVLQFSSTAHANS